MFSKLRISKTFRSLTILFLAANLTVQSTFAGSVSRPRNVPGNTPTIATVRSEPNFRAELSTREVYLNTLQSIAMVTNEEVTGWGTGWVVDVDRRLIVTNQHVVEGLETVKLFFPTHKNGELQTDLSALEAATPVHGVVIDCLEEVDLAIVQAESLPADIDALTVSPTSANPGERVHAIGGRPKGSYGLWKYSTGFVSLVSLTDFATGSRIRVMQSNIDINPGNSGGPVVNDRGEVVGVAQSIHTKARDVSYTVDATEVNNYLAEVLPLIDNNSADALYQLGKRSLAQGRPQAAMNFLSQAVNADPNLTEAQAERGWAFLDLGDTVTAINDFTASITKKPTLSTAYRGRAIAYRMIGEEEKAINDLSMGIANNPLDADLYNDRAISLENREQYSLAYSDYNRAIELDDNNTVILCNRARLSMRLEDFPAAEKDLNVAIDLAPNDAGVNNLAGLYLHQTKHFEGARKLLLRACEIDGDNAQYIRDFGETLQALSEHETAVKVWSLAIEKEDDHAYSFYSRAWSLSKLNKHETALADMNIAIQLDPNSATYFGFRGKVLEAMGRTNAAQADFARAAELNPER